MKIKHRIEYLEGDFDSETGKLSCGANKKYGKVSLCFDCGMSVGFAHIKLYSSDLAKDADATFEDAMSLCSEIARRWNAFAKQEDFKGAKHNELDQLRAVYDRFKHLDRLFEQSGDVDPFHYATRELWRAIKKSLDEEIKQDKEKCQ